MKITYKFNIATELLTCYQQNIFFIVKYEDQQNTSETALTITWNEIVHVYCLVLPKGMQKKINLYCKMSQGVKETIKNNLIRIKKLKEQISLVFSDKQISMILDQEQYQNFIQDMSFTISQDVFKEGFDQQMVLEEQGLTQIVDKVEWIYKEMCLIFYK